jgi:enamine deaminase RidA (YjgF/YER057c/UK114 family)
MQPALPGAVVDVAVFLQRMEDYAEFDRCLEECGQHRPTRCVVQVAGLPRRARLELKMIALVEEE